MNFDLEFHPNKANVVENVLSHKTHCSMVCLEVNEWDMLQVLNEFGLECLEMEGRATCIRL